MNTTIMTAETKRKIKKLNDSIGERVDNAYLCFHKRKESDNWFAGHRTYYRIWSARLYDAGSCWYRDNFDHYIINVSDGRVVWKSWEDPEFKNINY